MQCILLCWCSAFCCVDAVHFVVLMQCILLSWCSAFCCMDTVNFVGLTQCIWLDWCSALNYDEAAYASRLTPAQAVQQLLETITSLTPKESGRYLNLDGKPIAFWVCSRATWWTVFRAVYYSLQPWLCSFSTAALSAQQAMFFGEFTVSVWKPHQKACGLELGLSFVHVYFTWSVCECWYRYFAYYTAVSPYMHLLSKSSGSMRSIYVQL